MKKMQRLLSMMLVCCMLIWLLPTTSYAAFAGYDGTLSWLSDGGTLTFSGTGAVSDYQSVSQGSDLYGGYRGNYYRNNTESIILEDGVTRIGNFAFSGFIKTSNVTIADSVTSIGKSAFYNCVLLNQNIVFDYLFISSHKPV